MIEIDVTNQQSELPIDAGLVRRAVRAVLQGESIAEARIGVAVVDDATIRGLNRRYLKHDCTTDVLSFVLERSDDRLEGEVIVCAQTARSAGPQFGWTAQNELLLYVVHGVLHLVGHADSTLEERGRMQSLERAHLAGFGIEPCYEESGRSEDLSGGGRPC